MTRSLFVDGGATFDGAYRYRLWRTWANVTDPRLLAFVMLNPSTADEEKSDPTVERCIRRAMRLGFHGLIVVNIFALRSTDPKLLYAHHDPIGPENDRHIIEACEAAKLVICGWGLHGALMNRGDVVAKMIRDHSRRVPHCLHVTNDGQPGHPLYIPYCVKPLALPLRKNL